MRSELDHGDTKSKKKFITSEECHFVLPKNCISLEYIRNFALLQVDAKSEMQKTTFILKYQKFAPCQNLAHENINMFEFSSSLPSLKTRA